MEEFEKIKKLESIFFLEAHIHQNMGSKNNGHRQLIREDIVSNFKKQLSYEEQVQILNLDLIPSSRSVNISISHCPDLGGYVASNEKVGFDIEDPSRLKQEIIQRVATPEEIALTHNSKMLWTMKEAALKALHNINLIITDIQIIQIESHSETELWTYRAHSAKALDLKLNKGYFFEKNNLFFSIYFK